MVILRGYKFLGRGEHKILLTKAIRYWINGDRPIRGRRSDFFLPRTAIALRRLVLNAVA
jgi:hypothetical protein